MAKDNKNIGTSNTTTHLAGNCYQPLLPQGGLPKSFTPPKGGTGARTIELKTVSVPVDKKQG
jgi:hypothetical protein